MIYCDTNVFRMSRMVFYSFNLISDLKKNVFKWDWERWEEKTQKTTTTLVLVYSSKNFQTELGLNVGHCIILHLILPGQMQAVLGSGVGLSAAHSITCLLLSAAQGCGLEVLPTDDAFGVIL